MITVSGSQTEISERLISKMLDEVLVSEKEHSVQFIINCGRAYTAWHVDGIEWWMLPSEKHQDYIKANRDRMMARLNQELIENHDDKQEKG